MKILLGDFNEKTRERTFSNQEVGMTVCIGIVMIMVLGTVNFPT